MRILHVEDDADTRELVCTILGCEGWQYPGVTNAQDGLHLAVTETFDLFLIDNRLPGETGNALSMGLRALHPAVPILFYSAAAFPFDIKSAQACGAQGYLAKPAAPELLIAEIRRLTTQPFDL
jgi:DNA-binding response OmpR family regulator